MSYSIKVTNVSPKNLYFISDAHLGDRTSAPEAFLPLRGFRSMEENDQCILDDLACLPHGSTVINLGDFHCGSRVQLEKVFRDRLNITRWIHIEGNHDRALQRFAAHHMRHGSFTMATGDASPSPLHFLPGYATMIKVAGQLVWLAHYAHHIWPNIWPVVAPSWHLCGHSHGKEPELNPDGAIKYRLDLGVEMAIRCFSGTLVPWYGVVALMKSLTERVEEAERVAKAKKKTTRGGPQLSYTLQT